MKIVCSWCTRDMGNKEPLDDPTETHSICDKCKKEIDALIEKEDEELEKQKREHE